MKKFVIFLIVALFATGAVIAKDLRTVIFKVEQMECMNCEKKVKENIRFEKGLKKLETNLEEKTVTITYDADKTNVDKLKDGFKKIKYDAVLVEDKDISDK